MTYHIIPIDDLKDHIESEYCWCRPQIKEGGGLIIHNSLDRREMYEELGNQ